MFLGFLVLGFLEMPLRKASVGRCLWWSGIEVEIASALGFAVGMEIGIETGIDDATKIAVEEYA